MDLTSNASRAAWRIRACSKEKQTVWSGFSLVRRRRNQLLAGYPRSTIMLELWFCKINIPGFKILKHEKWDIISPIQGEAKPCQHKRIYYLILKTNMGNFLWFLSFVMVNDFYQFRVWFRHLVSLGCSCPALSQTRSQAQKWPILLGLCPNYIFCYWGPIMLEILPAECVKA